jgi:hypothetical protein
MKKDHIKTGASAILAKKAGRYGVLLFDGEISLPRAGFKMRTER